MRRDPTEFRERFKQWKSGNQVYEDGRPIPTPARHSGDMYDYQRAAELGYERNKDGHFSTRDYQTGRYLKNATHPTVMMSVVSDLGEGYYPYYNKKDGQIYSDTWMKLPEYRGGKDTKKIKWSYNDETGLVRKVLPDTVIVGTNRKSKKQKPFFVSSNTGQATLNDVGTGILAVLSPVLNPVGQFFSKAAGTLGKGAYIYAFTEDPINPHFPSQEEVNTYGSQVGQTAMTITMPSNYVFGLGNPFRGEEFKAENPAAQVAGLGIDMFAGKGISKLNTRSMRPKYIAKHGDLKIYGDAYYHQAVDAADNFFLNPTDSRWFSKGKLYYGTADGSGDVIMTRKPLELQQNGEFRQTGPLYNDDVTIFKQVGDGKFKRVKQNIYYEMSDVPINELFTYNGPVRNVTGADINAAAMRGIKAKYEKMFDIPENVKKVFQNQVIPRRLREYELGQQTSGVKKIQEYMFDYGDVDFSTPEGLRVANERGWSMREVQDYVDYVDYQSQLNDVLNTKYYTYPRDVWDVLNPIKNDRQTTAAYDPIKDRIELPEDFKPSSLIHELRHRMQKLTPKTNTEKNILKNAYGQATKEVELEPVNTTVRNKLLERNGAQNASQKVQNSILNSDVFISDDEILSTLSQDTAYGKDIVTAINSKLGDLRESLSRAGYQGKDLDFMLKQEKSKIVSQIREAMASVGIVSLPIVLRNLSNTNTENEL